MHEHGYFAAVQKAGQRPPAAAKDAIAPSGRKAVGAGRSHIALEDDLAGPGGGRGPGGYRLRRWTSTRKERLPVTSSAR